MFDEDLSVFFDTDDFAVTMIVKNKVVNGLFDNDYADPLMVESSAPSFLCKSVDVEYVAHGDIVIDGLKVYTVRNVRPDGNGMTRLMLELQ